MSRLLLSLVLAVFVVGGASAQDIGDYNPADITEADQVWIDRIEAQLAVDGVASLEAATDEQFAAAAAQLVNAGMSSAELNALLRAAILARPGAAQAILVAIAGAAADAGFGATVIASLIVTAMDTLRALGIPFDPDALINAVAAATGISRDVLQAAVDALIDLEGDEDLILEENPAQDASPT